MQFERNIVFWVAALAVLVALLWLLSPILLPFVLGMAIAYVLDPLANQLSKRGVSRLGCSSYSRRLCRCDCALGTADRASPGDPIVGLYR
jgi:hypothetical protein